MKKQRNARGPYKKYLRNTQIEISRQTLSDARKRKRTANYQMFGVDNNQPRNETVQFCDGNVDWTDENDSSDVIGTEEEIQIDDDSRSRDDYSSESDNEDESDGDDSTRTDGGGSSDNNVFESRFLKHNGQPLFGGSKISNSESLLLIFGFVTRHSLSNNCMDDLLKLMSLHLPEDTEFPLSAKQFKTKMGFNYKDTKISYYCAVCNANLGGNSSSMCHPCSENGAKPQKSCYIHCDIKTAIENVLKIEEVANSLHDTFNKRQSGGGNYVDIYSGALYKNMMLRDHDFTMTINSDGVQCFHSSKFSLSPILLSVNEISYPLRRRFTILGGIWFGQENLNYDLFLGPLVEKCNILSQTGVCWNFKSKQICSKIFFPTFVADSVERCKVQGIKQFNGKYSCPWCLCKGQRWQCENTAGDEQDTMKQKKRKRSTKWIFPPVKKRRIEKRTMDNFILHLQELAVLMSNANSDLDKISYYGIKKASKLLLLHNFDCVNGFTLDILHTCFLGVTKYFLFAWLERKKAEYYIGDKIKVIDDRFLRCLVPFETQRATRSLVNRAFWKANELKTFLCVFPIIFKGIFRNDKFIDHFTLFANSILLLCSDNLPSSSLISIEKDLFKFVRGVESLYGLDFCTSNVHLLLHATDCVRNWGPLYAFSAFQFESYNSVILSCFHGTQYVSEQITKKLTELSTARVLNQESFGSTLAKDLYYSFMYNKRMSTKKLTVSNVTVLGRSNLCSLTSDEKEYLLTNYQICATQKLLFQKAIIHDKMYNIYSRRTGRRCNSVVRIDSKYFLLQSILLIDDSNAEPHIFGSVTKLRTRNVSGFKLGFEIAKVFNKPKLVPINDIEKYKYICVLNEILEPSYIVQLPNLVELE